MTDPIEDTFATIYENGALAMKIAIIEALLEREMTDAARIVVTIAALEYRTQSDQL